MSSDCQKKKGIYIGKIHSLSQELHFVSPDVKMKLFDIYTHSFYGSNLWNLFGKDCDSIYKAFNVSVRNTFQVPRETHRYLIENICETFHPQVFLSSRYVKFHTSMLNCNKSSIRTIANFFHSDQRTVYGKNLSEISRLCSCEVNEITPTRVKQDMKYFLPPENEKWRGHFVHEQQNVI